MKNKIVTILFATLLSIFVIACSKNASTDAVEHSEQTDKEIEEDNKQTESDKDEMNAFSQDTNTTLFFDEYSFFIPHNWSESDTSLTDTKTYYAESGDAVAMLQFQCSDSPVNTIDELYGQRDSFFNGFSGGFDDFEISNIEILDIDAGEVLSTSFYSNYSDLDWDGKITIFISDTSDMITIMLMQSENTKFSYIDDYDKIIDSTSKCSTENNAEPIQKDIQTSSDATLGQINALDKAFDYLSFTAFSYNGLIDQLEYEGFSTEEATYAVDNCGADWNDQALKRAKSYLDFSSFSYNGLINQLLYEEFTEEQATYAANNCGADWNEQAAKKAQDYLDYSSFSRDDLLDQLRYEGFTNEQAEYGVASVGY